MIEYLRTNTDDDLPDVLVDVEVDERQVGLVLSGVGLQRQHSVADGVLDSLSQFLHRGFMLAHRLQQGGAREKNFLHDVLHEEKKGVRNSEGNNK